MINTEIYLKKSEIYKNLKEHDLAENQENMFHILELHVKILDHKGV